METAAICHFFRDACPHVKDSLGYFLAGIASSRVSRACVCEETAFNKIEKKMASKFVLLRCIFRLSARFYRLRLEQGTQNTQY